MNTYKECVLNACKCQKGSHPMFRGFGLNTTDAPARNPRLAISRLIREYYPEITTFSITANSSSFEDGSFKYSVEFNGVLPE